MTNEELRDKVLARFEGRDYVPGGPPRFAWHVHHRTLVELLTEPIANRVNYILENKPAAEISTRLEWLRPVQGKLPTNYFKARADYDKTWADYDKARADYDKARADYDKARADYDKARAEYDKTWAEYDKTWADYDKARAEYDKTWAERAKASAERVKALDECEKARAECRHELEALHTKECPGCPCNGEELIFQENRG